MNKKKNLEVIKKISLILQEWDPIGVIEDLISDGQNPDEYDSYVPQIYRNLINGATIDDIKNILEKIQINNIGLSPNKDNDIKIANKICKYWESIK